MIRNRLDDDANVTRVKYITISGHVCIILVAVIFFAWSTLIPLADSSLAQGAVTVGSDRQIVSHVDGGKIEELFVENGDLISAGQKLLKFDDRSLQAELSILRYELHAKHAAIDRLTSEREGVATAGFRESLLRASAGDRTIHDLIEGERRHFKARRDGLRIELAIIDQETEQAKNRDEKLGLQINSTARQINFVGKQIANNEKLVSQGYGKRATLIELKRERERLITQRLTLEGQLDDNRAILEGSELKREARRAEYIAEVQEQINLHYESQGQVEEQIDLTKSKISNTTIFASIDGVIVDIHFRSSNDVVLPASPIMEIVPRNSKLLVEASVPPHQIEGIFEGAKVEVRFPAFSNGEVPSTEGRVSLVSADVITDNRSSYYRVHVTVNDWDKLTNSFDVIPGMPTEIIISKKSRTFMNYLLGSLADHISKAFL